MCTREVFLNNNIMLVVPEVLMQFAVQITVHNIDVRPSRSTWRPTLLHGSNVFAPRRENGTERV